MKMTKKGLTLPAVLMLLATMLYGCGGGGGGSTSPGGIAPAPSPGETATRITGTARVPSGSSAAKASARTTAAVSGLDAIANGLAGLYYLDDNGNLKGRAIATADIVNGNFVITLPSNASTITSNMAVVVSTEAGKIRSFVTGTSGLDVNPISEYVVYSFTKDQNSLESFSIDKLAAAYTKVQTAAAGGNINFSACTTIAEAVQQLDNDETVKMTMQEQVHIALPYSISASVTPTSGTINDTYTLTCGTTNTSYNSMEGRCRTSDSWSLLSNGTKACEYSAAGSYTPGCRINRMSIDNVDAPVTVGEPTPLTVVVSVSPTSGTVDDEYVVTCAVSGGTYSWLEVRCDDSDYWFIVDSGNTGTCFYMEPGTYTPGCRVDEDVVDNTDTPVSVDDAANSEPSITSFTKSKSVVLTGNDYSLLNASASDPDGDTLTYSFSSDGGRLKKVNDKKYKFYADAPGEYSVTLTVTDVRGGTDTKTLGIDSFGSTASQGGIKGTVDLPAAATSRAAGPTRSANMLAAPVMIRPMPLRDTGRRVRYGNKSARISYCESANYINGEVLVKVRPGSDAAAIAGDSGLTVARQSQSGIALLRGNISGMNADEAKQYTVAKCERLNELPGVEYASLNSIHRKKTIPNDPQYGKQWHYPLIQLPQAWGLTTGSSDVVVAVVDTGIVKNHADLKANLIAGYDFVSQTDIECDGTGGIDSDPEDVADSRCASGAIPVTSYDHNGYHGTHVAGTIGAETNNGKGVAGINWNVSIMPVRVLGAGYGTDYDIMQGMLYAGGLPNDSGTLPQRRADIINISLGGEPGESCPAQYNDLFDQLYAAGVTVFVASGNESSNNALNPLAICNHAVAVGAVDRNSVKTSYSNAGPGLDIMAPGGDSMGGSQADGILSTIRDDVNNNDTGYAYYDGTSMATPHAAGVAALVKAANPDITPDQLVSILEQTATDLGAAGTDNQYGAGLINAYAAVRAAIELGDGSQPQDPALQLSATSLDFSASSISMQVTITNTGGGDLVINSITNTENSGGNWMSTSYTSSGDNFILTVNVNRSGLDAGSYTGTIDITSNGGNATIQVAMRVEGSQPPATCDNDEIYILAIAPDTCTSDTCDTVSQTQLGAEGGAYSMFEVEAGEHYVVAGTDCNGDSYICDEEVDKCGMYPVSHEPDIVTVQGTQFTEGIDFTLIDDFIESAGAGGAVRGTITARKFRITR